MKKIIIGIFLGFISLSCYSFEIIALGASGMNCKGVDYPNKFTTQLELLLIKNGINVTVTNAGVDGDRSIYMYERMLKLINPDTKIIIVDSPGNDKSTYWSQQNSSKTLAKLQELGITAIFISTSTMMTKEEGAEIAKKYNAYYYGTKSKDIPLTKEYYQGDGENTTNWSLGHMNAEGCKLWAKNMTPFVEQIIKERSIK